MSRDVPQREGRSLLDLGVKLLETEYECLESSRVDDGLAEGGGVLGHRAQHKGCRLLVEPLRTSKTLRACAAAWQAIMIINLKVDKV